MEAPGRHSLNYLKEARLSRHNTAIAGDVRKSSLALFISEVVSKTIREEEKNTAVFDFLEQTIESLEQMNDGFSVFHLQFLINFSSYLGFKPHNNHSENNTIFDLQEGRFQDFFPNHPYYLAGAEALTFSGFLEATTDQRPMPELSLTAKFKMLTAMLDYYHMHLTGMGQIRSLGILREVFR